MYNDTILNNFKTTKHAGRILKTDAVGESGSAATGILFKFSMEIENNFDIQDAKFQVYGCPVAIATASAMCAFLIGKNIKNVLDTKEEEIFAELKIPPNKQNYQTLAKQATDLAILNFLKKLKNQ